MSTATPETRTAYQCPECSTIYDQDDLVPIYECSRCSQTSIERRCEDDNIFMGRAGEGCESCGVETEDVEAVEDHDGQLILADDWDPSGSLADRDAADAEQQASKRAEKAEQEREARQAASEKVTVAALAAGDWIMHPAPSPRDPDATTRVQAILDWGGDTRGLLVAAYGIPQVFPVSPTHELTRVPSESTGRRKDAPFGTVTFNADGGEMMMSSAPRKEEYTVELAHMTRGEAPWGGVPCMTISRLTPGLLNVFAVFVSRGQAEAALAVWEEAGRALAEGRDLEPTPDRSNVTVEETPYSLWTDSLGRPVELTLGTSEWGDSDLPYLNVMSTGSNACVEHAGALLGAVEVAREHLGHLDH